MKENILLLGDSVELLKKVPDETVDLIFADPPFTLEEVHPPVRCDYLTWTRQWMKECVRVLKRTGSIYIQMSSDYAPFVFNIAIKEGLYYKNWIVWKHSYVCQERKRFGKAYTPILFFTRHSSKYSFNVQEKEDCVDTWFTDKSEEEATRKIDELSTPSSILERIIKTSSNKGDLILDPFVGSGTSLVVAKKFNRRYIGFDSSEYKIKLALRRLKQVSS